MSAMYLCEKEVRNHPSAQPERKKGEWINRKYRWIKSISMWWYSAYECSICGEAGIKDWDYCPNCGADMRGGEYVRSV